MKKIRLMIAGGGTGGHLYSGIAVAEILQKKVPGSEIIFVGTERGLEKKIVPQEGFALKCIPVKPLKGGSLKSRFLSLLAIPRAFFFSLRFLSEWQPDLVLGIGGYASGPMTLMAVFKGIPTAIIEQNSYPGMSNRILGRFVDQIFLSSRRACHFFLPSKIKMTGNPLRNALLPKRIDFQEDPLRIFLLGGSQGASSLNQALSDAVFLLDDLADKISVVHQCGTHDFESLKKKYAASKIAVELKEFISDIAPYYHQSHLMICRAGAGTVAELKNLAKASILIPYPYAADNHQYHNAMDLVSEGAGLLIPDDEISGEILAEKIRYFYQNRVELERMSQKALALASPDAAKTVLDYCIQLSEIK